MTALGVAVTALVAVPIGPSAALAAEAYFVATGAVPPYTTRRPDASLPRSWSAPTRSKPSSCSFLLVVASALDGAWRVLLDGRLRVPRPAGHGRPVGRTTAGTHLTRHARLRTFPSSGPMRATLGL